METTLNISTELRAYFERREQELGLTIRLRSGGANLRHPSEPGYLDIYTWSCRTDAPSYDTGRVQEWVAEDSDPAIHDALRMYCRDYGGTLYDSFHSTDPEGIVVEIARQPGYGFPTYQVATVEPGVIMLTFDATGFFRNFCGGEYNALRDAFFDSLITLALDPEAQATWAAAQAERNRVAMIEYVRRTSATGVDDLVNEIATYQNTLAQAVETIAHHRHKLRERQQLLDALLASREHDEMEAADKAWTLLQNDPRIASVTFSSGHVVMRTEPMNITHPNDGRVAYLGQMEVKINLENSSIRVRNIDNARGGFDHPHVNMGQPCFGEMGDAVHTLVRQGELYAAFEMMFMFFSSVNLRDDWGRRATFWFDADDNEARILTAGTDHDAIDQIEADLIGEDYEGDEDYEEEYEADYV